MELNKTKKGVGLAGILILLLGFCLVLAGCESDAVAPQENLPPLTEKGAAQQAGLVAVGIAKAGPQILNFNGNKELGIYTHEFTQGGISGSVMLEFFTGGAGGAHSHWDDADYGLFYTPEGAEITVALDLDGLEPDFGLTFDLYGDIDQVADTAAVAGSGNFTSGDSSHAFNIPDDDPVVVVAGDHPTGGMFAYSADGFSLVVVYDGDVTADVYVSDAPEPGYSINLDTGIVTAIE